MQLDDPYRSRFLDGIRKAAESGATAIDWDSYLLGARELRRIVRARRAFGTLIHAAGVQHHRERRQRTEDAGIPEQLLSEAASIVAAWIDDPNPSDEDGFGE